MITINQRSNKEWNSYDAVGIAEGFIENDDPFLLIEAWGYLIASGLCWQLQGSFGRAANGLIKAGYIDPNGLINWDNIPD